MRQTSNSTKILREQEQNTLKDQHKQEILHKGMALCLEKGVVDLDMKEVAAAAQLSRATLYRYYPSKKALVYAILRQQVEAHTGDYHAERLEFLGNGYEKFRQFVEQLVDAYRHYPDLFRLMGMVDFYYGTHDSPVELVHLYRDIFSGLLVGDTPHVYLDEGQHDGSVRTDIDPRTYTATVIATLVSLAEQVTANKEATQSLYGLEDADVMMGIAAEALVERIKR
ncbi:MAG: TetR/AcrR family transcriptional regulator [Candidatus Promineifilaceae bacterium]